MVRKLKNYIIYIDSYKLGDGDVITPGLENIPYWVWKYQWTMEIHQAIVTEDNPTETLTMNDLEL